MIGHRLSTFSSVFLLFAGLAPALLAAEPVVAPKATRAPAIDGILDDAACGEALIFTSFKTIKPDYGKEPGQKTEGYFLFDAENFYVAFRCYEDDPSQIKANISKRDDMFADDWVAFVLDTFSDAYTLFMNPLGIQGDGLMNV